MTNIVLVLLLVLRTGLSLTNAIIESSRAMCEQDKAALIGEYLRKGTIFADRHYDVIQIEGKCVEL